jgi:hypothetical protein
MVALADLKFFDSPFVQTWQFHDRAAGPGRCSVSLNMDGTAFASEDCAGAYPVLSGLTGWQPLSTSELELRKANGPFLRFRSVSPDALEAKDGGRTWVLGVGAVAYEDDVDAGAATLGGAYTLSAPDTWEETCELVLQSSGEDGLLAIELGEACVENFQFLDEVSGWQPVGTEVIRLIDANGESLVEFGFTGDGVTFDATEPLGDVSYRLVRPRDGE